MIKQTQKQNRQKEIYCLSPPEQTEEKSTLDKIKKSRFLTMSKYSGSVRFEEQMKRDKVPRNKTLIKYISREDVNNEQGFRFQPSRRQQVIQISQSESSSGESESDQDTPVQLEKRELSQSEPEDSDLLEKLLHPHFIEDQSDNQTELVGCNLALFQKENEQGKIGKICPYCLTPVNSMESILKVRHYVEHLRNQKVGLSYG